VLIFTGVLISPAYPVEDRPLDPMELGVGNEDGGDRRGARDDPFPPRRTLLISCSPFEFLDPPLPICRRYGAVEAGDAPGV
jgi:hypothetical protein